VTYANDDAAFQSRWVLGQVKQVDTQLPTAKTVSQTVFNASALPQDRYAFGLKVMSYTWNAQGQLATFKDGLNRTTTLANYTLGIPQLITFADTKTQSIGVSTFGEVSGITDENGATTNYQYDSLSRLRQTDYPAADVVTWTPTINEYFVGGANVLRSTTGRKRTTSTLDSFWRPSLTEEMDTTTGIAMYSLKGYDYSGRVTFESYPSTNNAETAGINSTYDALGRLFRRTTVDGVLLEQIDYLSGNRKQVTDADGRITTITYQAFDSPSYSNPLQIIAPESRTTVYLLDVYGKPLSATQSGAWSGGSVSATRSWFYDTNQRLCRMTEPETASTIYGYDAASQVTWELKGQSGTACVTTKPSTATSFTYDTRGRKTKDDYTGTADDVTYTYDFAGNLKTVVNPNATWTYTYNKRNFIETEQAVVGTKTFVIDPLYDTLGNLTQKTLPDGTVISYAPDAWGRSTQVGTYAIGVQYYPTGLVSSYTLGNGMTYSQSLDSRLRPYVQETTRAGVPFQRFVYGYTPAGDINSVSEAVDSVDTATFTYDGLHRVSTANGLWGAYTYAYDPLDNIRSRSGPSALTYTYNSTSNRLTNVAGGATRTYSYNANGEITGDGTRTFTLNTLGQVKQIGSIATYAFDGNGKRIKTTKGSVSEYALYERSGALVYSEVGTTKTSFVGLAGRALVELKNVSGTITPTYLHPDWLGSPRKASNASGNVLWNESFDPFGNKMNGVSEKVGYTGHASDSESGLTYAQARYYDPVVGRFLSPDPIRQLVDFNLYAYVGNDPVNRTDPTGMQEKLSTVREHAECGAAFCDFTWYGEGGDTTTSEPTTGKAPALNTGYAAWDGDKWVETSEPGVEQVCPECYVLMPGAPLKGALALRSAAAATKGLAPLAEVLNTIGARGFSGVFDTVTGRILIKPSTYEAVPAGWVSARGGHAAVSQLLGGSAAAHRGFAIILQENGTLAVSWLSRTLNPGNGYVAPELRAGIVKAIEAATGRTVSAL
jgi:RHS repeat-associated protein